MYKEIKKLYEIMSTFDPYLLDVSSDNLNFEQRITSYKICSACYAEINNSWDHTVWCALFKQEPLNEWLRTDSENR